MQKKTLIIVIASAVTLVIVGVAVAVLLSRRASEGTPTFPGIPGTGGTGALPGDGPPGSTGAPGDGETVMFETVDGPREVPLESIPENTFIPEPLDFSNRPTPQEPADSDQDGLSDEREAKIGSDPNKPDTDGDGFSDLDEYVHGSDPTTPDAVSPVPDR